MLQAMIRVLYVRRTGSTPCSQQQRVETCETIANMAAGTDNLNESSVHQGTQQQNTARLNAGAADSCMGNRKQHHAWC